MRKNPTEFSGIAACPFTAFWENRMKLFLAFLVLASPTAATQPLADQSLTPPQWVALGLPAADRAWTGEDYGVVASVLTKMASAHPEQLPRKGSERSGPYFAQIVSDDNLAILRLDTLPIPARLAAGAALVRAGLPIVGAYVAAHQHGQFDAELVDLMGFQLRVATALVPLAQAQEASLAPDDPRLEARREGYAKMRHGFSTMVFGALTTLTERGAYRTAELRRLAALLDQSLASLLPMMTDGSRQELPSKLRSMAESEPDAEMKAILNRMAQTAKQP